MTHQLKHVAQIYLANRTLWLVAGFAALVIGPTMFAGLVGVASRRDTIPLAILALGFGMSGLGGILVLQAKWQFCNPRARVLPGFAAPHLAALLGLILAGVGVYPVAMACACAWNPLGVAASAAALVASVVWGMHGPRLTAGLAAIVIIVSFGSRPGLEFWVSPENIAHYAAVHAAILAAGWVALVAWLRRLAALREEDDDYAIPVQMQQGSAIRMERTQASRALARHMSQGRLQLALGDRWHDRLVHVRAATVRSRQWLLRYGFAATPTVLPALLMVAAFFVMFVMISQWSLTAGRGSRNSLSSLPMMIIMPVLMLSGMFLTRRARLPQELCLPLTRGQLLGGLLAVMAGNAAVMALIADAAAVGLVATTNAELLTRPFLVGLLALATGAQFYAFGALIWISRKTSGGVRNVILMVAFLPAFSLLHFGLDSLPRPIPPPNPEIAQMQTSLEQDEMSSKTRAFVEQRLANALQSQAALANNDRSGRVAAIATALAALGAILLIDARRRWLQLELG